MTLIFNRNEVALIDSKTICHYAEICPKSQARVCAALQIVQLESALSQFYVSNAPKDGINLDCKVVGDCKPLPSVDDHVMIDRVLECAQPATGYGMINATTFLNHKVDTKLMDQAWRWCGWVWSDLEYLNICEHSSVFESETSPSPMFAV